MVAIQRLKVGANVGPFWGTIAVRARSGRDFRTVWSSWAIPAFKAIPSFSDDQCSAQIRCWFCADMFDLTLPVRPKIVVAEAVEFGADD